MRTFEYLGSLVLMEAAVSMTVSFMGASVHRIVRRCKERPSPAEVTRADASVNGQVAFSHSLMEDE